MRYVLLSVVILGVVGCKAEENSQQPTVNSQQSTERGQQIKENRQQLTDNNDQSAVNSEQSAVAGEAAVGSDNETSEDADDYPTKNYQTNELAVEETAVLAIPLSGDINNPNAELSGMAWYGEWLVLLPQYPSFSGSGGDGVIYALQRDDIVAFLAGKKEGPLEPREIAFVAPGLSQAISGYEGFEALVFDGDRAYLTIEASPPSGMTGHLVVGQMAADLSTLTIDTEMITAVPSATGLLNKSDETILLAGDQVLTLHEANGARVNESPLAQIFTTDLQPAGTLPFPSVEYRITDATAVDENGRFWAINYYFPGEPELQAEVDPVSAAYGIGTTHAGREGIERVLEFQVTAEGIELLAQPPIQLELLAADLRNWEGIARLEKRGFLLVTDKFPQTILGFVPDPIP